MQRKSQDPVVAVESAMVAIRRRQTRRTLARQAGGPDSEWATLTPVVDVIEAAGGSATVTSVADTLSVDQPRASRLVGVVVSAGLVRRVADQADGRRALLELTDDGRAHAEAVHRGRQAAFAGAMAGWSATERAEFARLLGRFVAALDGPHARG